MKPAPMLLHVMREHAESTTGSYDFAEAIIAARDKQWEEMMSKREPIGWAIQGSVIIHKGPDAERHAKAEAKRCGGTCYAYALYTKEPTE